VKKTIATVLMLLVMTAVTFAATATPTAPPQEPPTAEQQQWAAAIDEFIGRMQTDATYQRNKAMLESYERDKAKCVMNFTASDCAQRRKVIL
jgi:hypothetical protein